MADLTTPTLEDLRDVPEAAWLWDGIRARIVWANAAGIAYFDGGTLFDLIDRPFDTQEPGVERITKLSRHLQRGQVETALLHFPSAGATTAVACRCMVHALADGRPGVLAVAQASEDTEDSRTTEDILAAFDLLPSAAILIGSDGTIRHLNAAALVLLNAGQRSNLAALLGSKEAAEELLARLEAAGTTVIYRALDVRVGLRDIRITARRLNRPDQTAAHALLLLDDVTERRALELKYAGERPAHEQATVTADVNTTRKIHSLSPADAAAFENLGKTLQEGLRQATTSPATPSSPASEGAPRRVMQHIPEQIRQPLEDRHDAVLVARDGELCFANPAAAQLFGYQSGEDVINDLDLANRFAELGQSAPRCEFLAASGCRVDASVQMSIVPWLGGPARQFILEKAELAADEKQARPSATVIPLPQRTAPPEADQELRAILDTAADGIITLDAEARIHTFSAGAEAIFGYRIADVAGRPFADLLAPESRGIVKDYLAALQGPGLAAVFNDGREVVARVRQGGKVPLFLTIGKLEAPRSQAAFCAVVRDITQWKKTEQELREAKERAEATSRQKSEFLASVSHELRTPLNAIMGFSEVMRLGRFGEIGNEKYRGYLQDIHASGAHLLSLIDDLLDLSKVEAGKLELNFTSVNLADVVDYAMKMLQEQATSARVVLRKSMPANLPNVVADLRSMRQVMMNLLSNAIKFTDPGGQAVISAQMMPAGELTLRIKDTGIGMDEGQLKGALEPFVRVATAGRAAQGTGLGLPLTKALIEANRASLSLSSEPGKGTLAEITFPTPRVLAD